MENGAVAGERVVEGTRPIECTGRGGAGGGSAPRPHGAALLHGGGSGPLRSSRVGTAQRRDPRREGRGRLRAARRRDARKTWSQLATNVVVSKYFRGPLGTPQRERSVRQLIGRVVDTHPRVGRRAGLLRHAGRSPRRSPTSSPTCCCSRRPRFNSPVWFNVGVEPKPQCSRLLHPLGRRHDGLDPRLVPASEGVIFKGGSGSGVNLSRIRSSQERLARRRHGLGAGVVHARRRRLGGRDQVGRQDAARGQDGGAQRRPSRHRRVHPLQGRGGAEGLGAHRRRLRRLARRRRPTARSSSRTPTTRCA